MNTPAKCFYTTLEAAEKFQRSIHWIYQQLRPDENGEPLIKRFGITPIRLSPTGSKHSPIVFPVNQVDEAIRRLSHPQENHPTIASSPHVPQDIVRDCTSHAQMT